MASRQMSPLGEFLEAERKRRELSQNEFAKLIGVSSAALTKLLQYENPPEPKLSFLVRVARGTGADLCELVKLAVGEVNPQSTRARIIAQRIAALPPEAQEIIDRMLIGLGTSDLKGTQE